jgi:ribosomal protein S18 acetylase RimI-like enzyme
MKLSSFFVIINTGDNMEFNIRKLNADEIRKVSHLYDELDNPSFMEKRKEKILSRIQDIYVLENETGIIGEVTIIYKDDHKGFTIEGQRVYMEALRIEESHQNKGYGQRFVNAVIENIRNEGYKEITIGVEDDNFNAKHIYNKLGFTNFIGRMSGEKYAPEGYNVWMKKLS